MATFQDTRKLAATTNQLSTTTTIMANDVSASGTSASDKQTASVNSAAGDQHSTIEAAMINHPVFLFYATTSLPTSNTLAISLEQCKRLAATMLLINYLSFRVLQSCKKDNVGLVNWDTSSTRP